MNAASRYIFVAVIGFDDSLHQRMAHNVFGRKKVEGYALGSAQHFADMPQT